MSNQIVSYSLENGIATITLDDGAKNVMSPNMIDALNKALDRAEKDDAVVIITGREDVLSAGFDLKIMKSGALQTFKMLMGGFELTARLLAHPAPVIIACTGHAVAMGAFLLLSGDYRIGTSGNFKIMANEVAIGLTLPYTAIEVLRQRLTPAHFERAALLSETNHPESAVEAGFLDQCVPAGQLAAAAREKAELYLALDRKAHRESKDRARKDMLADLKNAIRKDRAGLVLTGVKRAVKL